MTNRGHVSIDTLCNSYRGVTYKHRDFMCFLQKKDFHKFEAAPKTIEA